MLWQDIYFNSTLFLIVILQKICWIREENLPYALWTQNFLSQEVRRRDYEKQIKHDNERLLTDQVQFSELSRLRSVKYSETEA